jgi:Trk-type K+ transport system membrane component
VGWSKINLRQKTKFNFHHENTFFPMFVLPIATLLIALALSLIITRVATMALMLTGLSRESARFQSRSAFTGVGFTTTEAESLPTTRYGDTSLCL